MPRQDGTGPLGQSLMAGRGLVPCGRGMRRGFGMGFGGRCQERAEAAETVMLNKEEQKKILEAELKDIETEKAAIEKKLAEIV
ncbi:MAG: DUF5320 domain-containing protein [Phycisphaerae bacterium]